MIENIGLGMFEKSKLPKFILVLEPFRALGCAEKKNGG